MSLEMNVKEMTIALNFKLPKKYQSAVILSPEKKCFYFSCQGIWVIISWAFPPSFVPY